MPRLAPIALATLLAAAVASRGDAQSMFRPDASRVRGRPVPDVALIDDAGAPFRLGALAGKPLVLSPIFTRCPHACVMITTSLRDALVPIGAPGQAYEVLTVTFDPADTEEDLRAYRERMELPPGWHMARGAREQIDSLLAAIDFHTVALEDGGFAHANAVAVLAPDLTVSGFVHGLAYDEGELRLALARAAAPESLVRRYRPLLAGVAVVAAAALVLTLILTRRRGSSA
jgi:protein SCO1/2